MSWTLKAVADVHGDDFGSCSTLSQTFSGECAAALANDDSDDFNSSSTRPRPVIVTIGPGDPGRNSMNTKNRPSPRLLRLAVLAALPAIALAAMLATGNLTSRAVQNAVMSVDMVTTGNSYDERPTATPWFRQELTI